MKVADLLAIKDSRTSNHEKAQLIARMMKLNAKRANPTCSEDPSGWNSSPYPGSSTDHTR